MRFYIFFCGCLIVALGIFATQSLDRDAAIGFLQGALTLGGGILIAGLFSLKMKWHGLIGAGVLALLGLARGLANVPDFVEFLTGSDRSRGGAPALEFGVTAICLILLLRVIQALQRERTRRMLEEK